MKKRSLFIITSFIFLFLAFCSLSPDFLGAISLYTFKANDFFFGEFALYYPFICFFLNYLFYKRNYDFKLLKKNEIIGLCGAFLGTLILFGVLSKNAGFFPEAFYNFFHLLFGRLVSGFLGLLILIFSLMILLPKTCKLLFGFSLEYEKIIEILGRFFGNKKENTSPNASKNDENLSKQTSINSKANFTDEFNENLQEAEKPSENLQNPVNFQKNEALQDEAKEQDLTEDFDEKAYLRLLSESQKEKEQIQNLIARASAEYDPNQKKPVYIPEKFLKPKKDKDFLAVSNFDEPSYKRNEEQENLPEPLKNEKKQEIQNEQPNEEILPFIISEVSADEKKEAVKENDEFLPIVEEFDPLAKHRANLNEKMANETEAIKKELAFLNAENSQNEDKNLENSLQKEPENLQENLQQNEAQTNLKPEPLKQDLKSKNSPNSTPENPPQNAYKSEFSIQTELASNTALLKDIEQGKLEKPKDFSLPPLEFLENPKNQKFEINEQEIDRKIYDLLEKLRRFKIGGDVISTYTGPVVTTFEFRPSADVKVSRILNLQDDLAMALKAKSIRIQAPIPGKDVVGIEVPNEQIQTIYLREILESEIFKKAKSPLTMALGKDIVGNAFVTDLKKLPHLLIAGTTGSGKSVGINAMLLSLLYRNSPKTLRLMMIDPKMLEFSIYNEIPHLLTPVITEPKKAINALSNMVAEMERRYKLMADAKTKNIENYNEKMKEQGQEELAFIVVIIDELADLMMTAGKDVEFYIARLAQMARASGIHLIVATQRPSVDVVTGLIKANLPSRLAYKVGQKIDSKVILDTQGAESLLGRGDCLFTPPGTSSLVRLHAPFASEFEIEKIVEFLKEQQVAEYDENFLKDNSASGVVATQGGGGVIDELFEEAKRVILEDKKTSISYLQRRLNIGYNRAANIIEQLSDSGFLTQPNAKGQREII